MQNQEHVFSDPHHMAFERAEGDNRNQYTGRLDVIKPSDRPIIMASWSKMKGNSPYARHRFLLSHCEVC